MFQLSPLCFIVLPFSSVFTTYLLPLSFSLSRSLFLPYDQFLILSLSHDFILSYFLFFLQLPLSVFQLILFTTASSFLDTFYHTISYIFSFITHVFCTMCIFLSYLDRFFLLHSIPFLCLSLCPLSLYLSFFLYICLPFFHCHSAVFFLSVTSHEMAKSEFALHVKKLYMTYSEANRTISVIHHAAVCSVIRVIVVQCRTTSTTE